MSDIVVPSFFPTPLEIVNGIRWVKDHPIVVTAAAAAATAASVLTYFKTATEDECIFARALLSPAKKQLDDQCSSTESDSSTSSRDRTLSLRNLCLEEYDVQVEKKTEEDARDACEGIDYRGYTEEESVSPQWGWYVSTTPPEEYYQDSL